MYDTVRFVGDCGALDKRRLVGRGWTCQTTTKPDGTITEKAFRNADNDATLPRLTWYESGYVTAECSLPKLLHGENVTLIHQTDLPAAFSKVSEYVSDAAGVAADVAGWNLSRVDFCFAWSVGDLLPLYLEAVGRLHLSRHNRQGVNDESVTWYSRGGKVLFYDKHKESKLDAARGVLRLEAVVRDTHYLSGDKHKMRNELALNGSRRASDVLTDEVSKVVLDYFLERLGLSRDKPIMSRAGLLGRMVKEFGVTSAEKLWFFAQVYELYGAKLADGLYKRKTFYRRRKALAEAGMLTWHNRTDVVLPALTVAV